MGVPTLRILLPVLLALLAWAPSIWIGGWALDDRELVEGNPVVEGHLSWTAAFGRDYFHHVLDTGAWRPLASLSLRADRALFGGDARGFHGTNVALHALVVALAAWLAGRLGAGRGPWLGVCAFAVHPALADSVAWISGRTSMVSALPLLAGALALHALARRASAPRSAPAGSPAVLVAVLVAVAAVAAAASFLAACGKEDAPVLALGLLPLVAASVARRAAAAAFLGALAGAGAALLLRAAALGAALPRAPFAPLAGEPLLERLGVGGAALIEAARWAAWPAHYPPRHDLESLRAALPLAPAATLLLGAALFLALAAGPWLARARAPGAAPSLAGWSAALAALAVLPWLQVVPAGELLAPRFLYLPLLAAIPLVDALLRRALPSRARPWVLALALLLALPAAWQRSGVYAGRAAFRAAILAHSPRDAPSWNDLGLAREEEGDLGGALAAWARAAELDPSYSKPWSNLGRVQLARGELDAAEASLRRAVALGPRNPVAHVNLASARLRLDRPRDAEALYLRATELAPGLGPAWRGLGLARLRLGFEVEARAALERALELDPGDREARRALGRAQGPAENPKQGAEGGAEGGAEQGAQPTPP